MKLLPELLSSTTVESRIFSAVFNAHGLYNTEQFVLRLSQINHRLIDQITDNNFDQNSIDSDTIQAYSTYLHETIHWWQHVGSTTGLVMSLCYPLQTHINWGPICDWCKHGPVKKSIKSAAMEGELSGKTHFDARQRIGNMIVNNTMDFEFFKMWILQPERSEEIYNHNYFESQGHCFSVVYGNLLIFIAHMIDPNSNFLHSSTTWELNFENLKSQKVTGYYYGSPLTRRRVGVIEIFEGQACFSQMHFLATLSNSNGRLEDFRRAGMLFGVYEKAFTEFLSLSKLEYPRSVLDPIVGLFLLVCDLAINPVEGFPCDIKDFQNFIYTADPGIRFESLCRAIVGLNVDKAIKEYSKQEYLEVSSILISKCGLQHPSVGWDEIQRWVNNSVEVNSLMKEHASFQYSSENIVLRVMLSHFIALTLDKRNHPEFFCWPGHWKATSDRHDISKSLWLKHLSLFTDAENDDSIFIRRFPNRNSDALMKTFNEFFGSTMLYDLSRQWVLNDGEFLFDFRWLSEKYEEADWKLWADKMFEKQYGVSVSNIII